MKRERLGQLFASLIYLVVWSFVVGLDMRLLISVRDAALTLFGAVLLTAPFAAEIRKSGGNSDIRLLWKIFKRQLTVSGYLASFILVFSAMTSSVKADHVMQTVALCLRPALYGIVLYLVFGGDTQRVKQENKEAAGEAPKDSYEVFRLMGLTAREAEIAVMIGRRMSNREIAEELYISETTVKKHVSHIFEKLEVNSREEIGDAVKAHFGK